MKTSAEAKEYLSKGVELLPEVLEFEFAGWGIRIRSNTASLLRKLEFYFRNFPRVTAKIQAEVIALERSPVEIGLAYTDWQRETGKIGRKDAIWDLSDGRLVHKVRTGMLFLQSENERFAIGPCLSNDNQVINFINAQYMNHLLQQDWQICHAAGVVRNDRALAVAGFSGGGKSTLMLRLMDGEAIRFLTNDRLFVRRDGAETLAAGIPKMPRINPGTALNNPRLVTLLPDARRKALSQLDQSALWDIEEKYDVDVATKYGEDRIAERADLAGFLILNWSRDASTPCRIEPIDIFDRRDLLAAVMKSPGPFYQLAEGVMLENGTPCVEEHYLAAFSEIPFFEATGMIDFDGAASQCLSDLLPPRDSSANVT
ncbi:MAG: hypothetical protein CBB92_03545 [Flammeovirgaceae bacterium TMED32]|nr:HprK-related kinase B [Rhodospirillaceae bacterium]OUU01250.1 MAG: hypothetical protein CBB92_03545 [Flammeovirgaceae bacterium TMED32]|tara:strand:+ start:4486 stop:5598 length:1113 start_codon:yes stop_codon:yes gene_type:complete